MGINEPTIKVECDKCGESDEYDLTMLAGGGWDDRNLKRKMERGGWVIVGPDAFCSNCAPEERSDV
jgi:hypothetical protein